MPPDQAGWNRLLAESERLRARGRARVRSTVTGLPLFVLVVSLHALLPRDPHGSVANRRVGTELGLVVIAVFVVWGVAPICMARWVRSGERRGWRRGALVGQPVLAVVWFGLAMVAHDAFDAAHPSWVSNLQYWLGYDAQTNTVLRYLVAAAVVVLLVVAAVWEVVAVERDVRRLDALGGVPDCPRRPGTACLTWCDCER
jgi:hypothetical protein